MLFFKKLLTFLSVLLIGVSCHKNEFGNLPSPYASEVQLTSAYPGVARVISFGQLCTGVFVSPRALLTASHCVRIGASIEVQTEMFRRQADYLLKHGPGAEGDAQDLAVVVFRERVMDRAFSYKIGNAELGETVHLVGYGCNNSSTHAGTGQKRAGTNVLYRITEYLEVLTPIEAPTRKLLGPSNRAGSCFGDSGGPMFVARGNTFQLVGVDHAVIPEGNEQISAYTNLTEQSNRDFLKKINSDLSLEIEGL